MATDSSVQPKGAADSLRDARMASRHLDDHALLLLAAGPQTIPGLCEALLVKVWAVSTALARLRNHDLVTRRLDRTNRRRSVEYSLSAGGLQKALQLAEDLTGQRGDDAVRAAGELVLARRRLPTTKDRVLAALSIRRRMTYRQLRDATGSSEPAVRMAVARLVEMQLVQRPQLAFDWRSHRLEFAITDEGQALAERKLGLERRPAHTVLPSEALLDLGALVAAAFRSGFDSPSSVN